MLEQTDHDARLPSRTVERIVPVTVSYEFELQMRRRADCLRLPLEDVLSECITVVPEYCFSPVEEHPGRAAQRVALHTVVEPDLAARVDRLATDERDWLREAVREKAARELGSGAVGATPGP